MGALASAILREKVILCTVVKIIRDMKKLKILLSFNFNEVPTEANCHAHKNFAYS